MKAIIQCSRPEKLERIARGEQTVKVCKTAPKETPFRVYMYCTKDGYMYRCRFDENRLAIPELWNGKVVGEYVCENVEKFTVGSLRSDDIEKLGCLSYTELINCFYKPWELDGKTVKQGKALHIPAVKFYDKPKELGEFVKICPMENRNCVGCEFYSDYSGSCTNYVTRPPRGWQYVEPLDK